MLSINPAGVSDIHKSDPLERGPKIDIVLSKFLPHHSPFLVEITAACELESEIPQTLIAKYHEIRENH